MARAYNEEPFHINAFLNLYDGCGNMLEEWLFSEIKILSINFGYPGYTETNVYWNHTNHNLIILSKLK